MLETVLLSVFGSELCCSNLYDEIFLIFFRTYLHEKYILHIKLEGCGVIKYKCEFLYFPWHSDETETH